MSVQTTRKSARYRLTDTDGNTATYDIAWHDLCYASGFWTVKGDRIDVRVPVDRVRFPTPNNIIAVAYDIRSEEYHDETAASLEVPADGKAVA